MLIQNGSIYLSNPNRSMFGVGILNDTRISRLKFGAKLNQSTAFGKLAATPAGYYLGSAWIPPKKNGAMSSRNQTWLTLAASATGAEGLGGSGSSSFLIEATALGQLIASAIGSTTFEITSNGSIVATIGSPGTAAVTITASMTTGAIGWVVSDASFSIDAAIISYGLGHMIATTDVSVEVTPENIAQAVWNSVSADFDTTGTMAELLQASGAGGNPWVEEIENNYSAKEAMRIILSALAGKVSGAGTGTIVFRNINDSKDRITADVDDKGNREAVAVDVS